MKLSDTRSGAYNFKKEGDIMIAMMGRLLWSLIATIICFIPLWMFLGVKLLLKPTGFWQSFVIYGAGIYFLGFIQLLLIVALSVLILLIWKR